MLLEVVDLSKSYGPVKAVRGLSLDVRVGEVHAICGHNGAGKSTLVKSLVGLVRPDEGAIRLDGRELSLRNPHEAQGYGIALVNQELSLVPELSVEDNIFLGGLHVPLLYRRRRLSEQARGVLDQLGLGHVQLGTAVETLSIGERQLVEIARLLVRDARLLILDEPTATLSKPEIERVFRATRELVAQQRSVIFVSHRLDEVFELCDRVTVLRDGMLRRHARDPHDRPALPDRAHARRDGGGEGADRARARAARIRRGGGQDRPAPCPRERRGAVTHARERDHHRARRTSGVRHERRPPCAGWARPECLRHDRGRRPQGAPEHAAARSRRGRPLHPERPSARRPVPRADGRAQPDGHAAPAVEPARSPPPAPCPAERPGARNDGVRSPRPARPPHPEPQRRKPAEGAAEQGDAARGHGAARPRRADPRRRRRGPGGDPQPHPRDGPQRHGRDLLVDGARRGPRSRGRRRHHLRGSHRLGRPAGAGIGLDDPRGHDHEPERTGRAVSQ